jgi:FAD/FMN-containing dehydrogenase
MEALERFRHITPAVVRPCASAAEVADAIAEARERGLEIAVRSGGHCFAGRSSTTGLLIDVEPMNHVELDGDIATIGAGARLGSIYDALAEHGRTIAGGCGPTVGIAGLALGGGLGILGRKYGLTCDQMVGAQVVLADGRVVETDEQSEPDLFWALRGSGGGQFGVVTQLTMRTVEAPDTIECFRLSWPREHAAKLIGEWQEWSPDAPEDLAASLIVHPDQVHVFGAGPLRDDGPRREGAEVTRVELPYRQAKQWLVDNGPAGAPDESDSKSEFFRQPLPTSAVQALAAQRDGELDFSPWGGAYNRPKPDATAFAHRDERFLIKLTGPDEWLRRAYEITHRYGSGGVYPNFPDPGLENALTAYHGGNLKRLQHVKAAYDPDNVFRFPQSL